MPSDDQTPAAAVLMALAEAACQPERSDTLRACKPQRDMSTHTTSSRSPVPPLADAVAHHHAAEGIPLRSDDHQLAVVSSSPRVEDEPPNKVCRHAHDADVTAARQGSQPSAQQELGGSAQPLAMPRLLHVFSGHDRPGGLCDAARSMGVFAQAVDIVVDPVAGDILNDDVYYGLMAAVMRRSYDWVWLGPVCSSFSRLRGQGEGPPRVRSRTEPMGMSSVGPEWRAYVRKHNEFVYRSVALASAAFQAGATFVIEHPLDRGQLGSPYFLWDARPHASLWVTPPVMQLVSDTNASFVHFPQCAFGSPFQKLTTLLTAGPASARLRVLGNLRCEHRTHGALARGFREDGIARSAETAAYPPLMCTTAVALMVLDIPCDAIMEAVHGRSAARFHSVVMHERRCNALAAHRVLGEPPPPRAVSQALPPLRMPVPVGEWHSAPVSIPLTWKERSDVYGEAYDLARSAALRYLSRRRSEQEGPVELFRRALPMGLPPPQTGMEGSRASLRARWPAGAPPRPIHISQLYFPGKYEEVVSALREARQALASPKRPLPSYTARAFTSSASQPQWARTVVWDTRDPDNCVPLQPYWEEERVEHDADSSFFEWWAERLGWTDLDMIQQVCITGVDSRSECARDTVLMCHHTGLRQNPDPAHEQIQNDVQQGWASRGFNHPPTVPCRMVAKNVVTQYKWRISEAGELFAKTKYRVTTDDSLSVVGTDSRNEAMDREGWPDMDLPGARTLGEAVAILQTHLCEAGISLPQSALESVAVWVLDLCDAYRMLGTQRGEWWQQCYVWTDGVHIDYRCLFGSAHLPGVFQRVSTFIVAVALRRIQAFDRSHHYSTHRQRWRESRKRRGLPEDVVFARVYLDDVFGCTVLEPGEQPVGGHTTPSRPVQALCELVPSTGGIAVRLSLFARKSRAEIHLALAIDTCEKAGWRVNPDKCQIGRRAEVLGMMVDATAQRISIPEAKRRGLLGEIRHVLRGRTDDSCVPRAVIDTLVGRCSHVAMVVPEANAYLAPMWRMQHARRTVRLRRGGHLTVRPQRLAVYGTSVAQRQFRAALLWWVEALEQGVSVPLAPRLSFPSITDSGCAYGFTDAAREEGTGIGGFSVVHVTGVIPPVFFYLESRWPTELRDALFRDQLSMAAGELFGLAIMAEALYASLGGMTHIIMFSDSSATVGAVQTACSPSPQMNHILQWLFGKIGRTQVLAVHQPGVRNVVADAISRHGLCDTLREARAHGLELCPLTVADDAWTMLRACTRIPQARAIADGPPDETSASS